MWILHPVKFESALFFYIPRQYPAGYPSDKEGKKTKGQSKKQTNEATKRPASDGK